MYVQSEYRGNFPNAMLIKIGADSTDGTKDCKTIVPYDLHGFARKILETRNYEVIIIYCFTLYNSVLQICYGHT